MVSQGIPLFYVFICVSRIFDNKLGYSKGNAKVWATKDLEAPMTTFNVSDGIVWEAKFMESGNEKIVTSASQNCGLQIWVSV